MGRLEELNPAVAAVYFLAVAAVVMFSMNPVIALLSLFGSAAYFTLRNKSKSAKTHVGLLGLILLLTVINPIVNRSGATVLFMINDAQVTLEAVCYGAVSAVALVSAVYWFISFSQIMTGEKITYLFGRVSPKLALLISMALRYTSLFTRQMRKTIDAQKGMGVYREDNIIDKIRGGLRAFAIVSAWGIENGIITADSMESRGYGEGKRSFFSRYRFSAVDGAVTLAVILLFSVTVGVTASGGFWVEYYPKIASAPTGAASVLGYVAYGALVMLPTVLEVKEAVRWRYLQSKI